MMRSEHGLTERNTFREPFCGEVDDSKDQQECKIWRDEYNKLNGTNFTLADTIPVTETEEAPADFTFDVFFNKDMPQSWFDPRASYSVSVTSNGKKQFDEAVKILINFHPNKKFQLEGHASIEKPANDPGYNDRLSKRRVELILSELAKNNVDPSRLGDKGDSTCGSFEDGMKNCSDSESSKGVDANDRRVVIYKIIYLS
jgi:outer membrane protein OmpA-like peptidoglycan-associated protein